MGQRTWQKPMLIVLVRSGSQEMVLQACKGATNGGPGVLDTNCAWFDSISDPGGVPARLLLLGSDQLASRSFLRKTKLPAGHPCRGLPALPPAQARGAYVAVGVRTCGPTGLPARIVRLQIRPTPD